MGKILKLLFVLGVGYSAYLYYEYKTVLGDAIKYTSLAVPLLNDVSKTWSYLSLEDHIDPIGFKGNEKHYKKMMERVSYLGEFKVCEKLSVGAPQNLDVDGMQAITGVCKFENGEGEILQVIVEESGQLKTMTFLIKPFIS